MMAEVTLRGSIKLALLAVLLLAPSTPVGAEPNPKKRKPDVSDYEKLQVPKGHKLTYRAYAEGVQIYKWDGVTWVFVAPEAVLYDYHDDDDVVGTHYAGPTWEHKCGSKVRATVVEKVTVDADAIPWLLLGATGSEGHGVFKGVTYIQRARTVGGLAPARAGKTVGEVARIPYAADYYFYKKHK